MRVAVVALLQETPAWCLRQESNLYLALRRRSFYPLNYGGGPGRILARAASGFQLKRQDQIRSKAVDSPVCARSVKRWATR